MNFAAGKMPEQPTIDRTKCKLTRFSPLPSPLNLVQNPGNFGSGEIWINQQTGFFDNRVFQPPVF